MKNLKIILLILALWGCGWGSLQAQYFGDGKRAERLRALWVAYVTQELELTAEESEKFWPVFNEFKLAEREIKKQKRKIARQDPKNMTETEVDQYFETMMQLEEEMIALRRKSYQNMKQTIPAQKVVQLPALERAFKKKILELVQERRGNTGDRPQGPGRRRGRF